VSTVTASFIVVDTIKTIDKGNLKAFVTVTINKKVRISGLRIVQQPGQTAWVSMPQSEVKSDNGKPKYYPIVEILDPTLKQQIQDAVLERWASCR